MKDKVKQLFNKGFFHIFGSSAINKVIAFLSSIVLVRILSKTEYGAFTYAWNIYGIVLLCNGLGLESGTLQLASEHSGDADYGRRICSYGTKLGLKINIIPALLLACLGAFAPLKIESGRRLLIALCVLPFLQFSMNMTNSYLRAQKCNKEYARLQVINTFLLFVSSASFALLLREMGLVIGHYLAYIGTLMVSFLAYRINLIKNDYQISETDKEPLLKISFISMLNNGLSQLMFLIDVFILGIVDPQETILASYKVATMVPTALTFIPASMITFIYPYFAEHKDDGKWCMDKYKQLLLGMGVFNICASLVLIVFANPLVKLLFGEAYLDAVPVFRLLAANYFVSGTFRTISGNLLVTQRKLKFNLFVAIVSSSINIIADYFFIQWWGSRGAAYATMIVVLISSIMSTSYLIYTFKNKQNNQQETE